MKKKHKFKIGDRVVYRCRGQGGNGWLDGEAGVVKHISDYGSNYDYDVEFDRIIPENMGLAHFGIRDGHGWACTEEHLQAEGSDEEDGGPDIKEKKKEEERLMGRRTNADNIDWAKADYIIRDRRQKGEAFEKIGETLGCHRDTVRNRYKKLVEIGFIKEDDHACENREEETVADTEKKAELNELEEAMAAVISEQKEEIDFLQGRVRGLESEVAARTEEAMEAKRLVVKQEECIAELEGELQGVEDALKIAEESMDEERQQKELLAKELVAAREALESKEASFMSGIQETLRRYDERIKEISEERDRYLRLALRLSESVVGL